MPRKLRIEYPGAMYDVLNRGDQRENGVDEVDLVDGVDANNGLWPMAHGRETEEANGTPSIRVGRSRWNPGRRW